MKLEAIFWDYPQFLDENFLRDQIQTNKSGQRYEWFLYRFLEYGRVVDTFKFFTIHEIAQFINQLKLTPYTKKKWKHLIDVYTAIERK